MSLERQELADKAGHFVQGIVDQARLSLETKAEVAAGGVKIELRGQDSELLLTDNARLLYAINHLVNQIFYRQSRDGCNFTLDCSGYRDSRVMELELMAEKAAEQVLLSGSKISLQPMPSSERRIIHLALARNEKVRTASEGSGHHRRVLIIPTH